MKKYLWAGLLGLSLLILPARAQAGCFTTCFCCQPVNVSWNADCCLKVHGGPIPQCGPWYLYWPLEAHFGPPAPTGYPFWPPPMSLPVQAAQYAAPHAAPVAPLPLAPAPVAPLQQTAFQPVGYYQQAPGYYSQGPNFFQQAPSYWYGR